MQTFDDKTAPYQLAFEAYGMQLRICTNSRELLDHVELILPPGWLRRPRSSKQGRLGLLDEGNGIYSIYRSDGACIHDAPGREYALTMLETQIEGHIALDATEFVFIHAGVVADGGRAIVIPGPSFSGKTTLVRALVDSGAVYYSDEFAALDETGRVLPYAKRLTVRRPHEGADGPHKGADGPHEGAGDYSIEQLGGVTGVERLPMGLVIATRFRPGAEWQPRELTPGAGALAMLEHAVPAQARPEQTLRVLKRALQDAVILEGERGEANDVARVLLDTLRAAA
jgi:hypothetical protein